MAAGEGGADAAATFKGEGSGPNMRANWLSLYKPMLIFTVEVAKNLAGPAVVLAAGAGVTVLHSVSVELAVR